MGSEWDTLLSEDSNSWWVDRMYLQDAWAAASYSQDRSTQVGSVLVIPNNSIGVVMRGWNCIHDKLLLGGFDYTGADKGHTTEHAERKTIYKMLANGFTVEGMTMYCTWASCSECARAMVEFGITRVVTLRRLVEATPDRWQDSVRNGLQIMNRGGIRVVGWRGDLGVDFPLRFDRREITNGDLA